MTYGFVRLEVIGAMVSVMTIWLLTGILVYEGVLRLQRFSANPNRKEVREGERERESYTISFTFSVPTYVHWETP